MQPYQPHIHNFTVDSRNLHPVSHPYAETADEKEISGYREDDVLQRHGNARREQAGKGGDRSDLAGESECDHDGDHEIQNNLAQQQELIAPSRFMNVAYDRLPPHLRNGDYESQHHPQNREAYQKALESSVVFRINSALPIAEIGLIQSQQHNHLAQGY